MLGLAAAALPLLMLALLAWTLTLLGLGAMLSRGWGRSARL
ncbi:MAG: hypothetical protein ACRDPO_16030 [Streptosporangiaceae bacterium]